MKRAWTGLLAAGIVVVLAAGCDTGSMDYYYDVDCSRYDSCGDCTPVLGCGWCFNAASGSGQGFCSPDPGTCAPASWTWNPNGCHAVADAGIVRDGSVTDGSSQESSSDTGSKGDAGDTGSNADGSGDGSMDTGSDALAEASGE